jgi:O-antigen/teichoic acid export membrane protein
MILIKRYGSIGAGISTLIIFIVSGIIGNIYLYISLKNKKQV